MPTNNAINLSDQGVTYYDGAGTFSAAPITQYNTLVGDASGNIASVAPTVTAGNPLVSQGASANPAYSSTATVDQITIVDLPVNPSDGVNKNYADLLAAGFSFKAACLVATTADLNATYNNGAAGVGATLTNAGALVALSIDGVALNTSDRILVKDMSTTAYNGIYSVTVVGSGAVAWELTRTTDFDTVVEIVPGVLVPVLSGTANAGTFWDQTETVATIGTDPILFANFGVVASQFLQKANNLSDVASAATSRTNLGLTNVAIQNVTNHAVLVGGAANAITSIAAATAGNVLLSTGASSDPDYVGPTAGTGLILTSNATTLNYGLDIPVLATSGGTGLTTFSQGDILYSPASNTLATLAKNTTASRYLSNTGTSNNPAWAQVTLTNGVTGTLPVTNGGTGLATVSQGDIFYSSASNTISTLSKDTNSTRYLSNTGTTNNPAWSQVGLTTGVTGILPVTNGGTGVSSTTAYAVQCGGTTGTGAFQPVASVGTTGQVLTSNGAGALPSFQTSPAAGSLILLSSKTFSAQSSVTFTSLIDSTYNIYKIVVQGLSASSTGTIQVQLSVNNGGSYITTGYISGENSWSYNATTQTNYNISTGLIVISHPNATSIDNVDMWLYNLQSGSGYVNSSSNCIRWTSALSNSAFSITGSSYATSSQTVDAIRINNAGGGTITGTVSLYGLVQ